MKVYNKVLFSNKGILFDCFGNKDQLSGISEIEEVIQSLSELENIPETLDHIKFSIILNKKKTLLCREVLEIILSNMQKIEVMLCQLLLKHRLTLEEWSILDQYLKIMDQVKDGKLSSKEFDNKLQELRKNNTKAFEAILLSENLATLDNTILDELLHCELNIVDCINNQIRNLRYNSYINSKSNLNNEFRSMSIYADNAVFNIQDAIKANYKVLDVLSKLLHYTKDLDKIKNRIPQAYFSDSKKIINKWDESKEKESLLSLYNELEVLTSIRDEITHNSSMNHNRQHVFIGNGTPCIKGKELCYSDILFWDYTGKIIDKSNARTGFFRNNKNSVSEVRLFHINVIKYVFYCTKYIYINLSRKINEIGIPSILLWDSKDGIDRLYEVKSDEIMNWFKEIEFE